MVSKDIETDPKLMFTINNTTSKITNSKNGMV